MIDIDNNIDFFKSKDAKSLDKVFCTMIYRFKDVPRKFKHVIEFKCKKFEKLTLGSILFPEKASNCSLILC